MPRLLRLHFASIGHPDARLAPLHIDLRARDGTGTGVDSILWLRNGGGKSTILNLFYALFRPDRREFLGASAEGKARHIEDYVKADDLAFVVTEWDVEPPSGEELFARAPARRRVVGQVLSWKDRQKSSDPSKLRRRFFSFIADRDLTFDDLPIDGLGEASRTWDAFRDWLDAVRQQRPDLEAYWEDTPRKWTDHLEKIGLDPELFRYQLKMNQREGSADEAFRFRTTDEFIRFYLEVSFDAAEADRVSANVEGFRDKLARRPELLGEREFLTDARQQLIPLRDAVAAASAAAARHDEALHAAAAAHRAVARRRGEQQAIEGAAAAEAEQARGAEQQAVNDATRLSRWAKGLERRALELDVDEATAAHGAARAAQAEADGAVQAAEAAVLRDRRRQTEIVREAKAEALRVVERDREPQRAEAARRGATVRARLAEAAADSAAQAEGHRRAVVEADAHRKRLDARRGEVVARVATLDADVRRIDDWLAARDRERERHRDEGRIELREEAADAVARWRLTADTHRDAAARSEEHRRVQLAAADTLDAEARALAVHLSRERALIREEAAKLERARDEQARLQAMAVIQEIEASDAPDVDASGLVDRLNAAADLAHRQQLVAAVDGAEDERAWQALDRTGRLPPAADVERALGVLRSANTPAWSGTEYLAANVEDPSDREELVRRAPHVWHGVIVPDAEALRRAGALLATLDPRMPVTVAHAHLDVAADAGHVVLPGHAAHWDPHAGARLRDALDGRRRERERRREELRARERDVRAAAGAVSAWREAWGDGRLAMACSDHDLRVASAERQEARQQAAEAEARVRRADAAAAEQRRVEAERLAARADRDAERVEEFVARYELDAPAQRDRRAAALEERVGLSGVLEGLAVEIAAAEADFLASRDAEAAALRQRAALLAERDAVTLFDDDPGGDDLATARAAWQVAWGRWTQLLSDNRLQWELDELDVRLAEERAAERAATSGREVLVDRIPPGGGEAALALARPVAALAHERAIAARIREKAAKDALAADGVRRRDADDLPSDAPPPVTADEARARVAGCREAQEQANARVRSERERAVAAEARQRDADAEASRCEQRLKRLLDALVEPPAPGPEADLPERAIDAVVDARLREVRETAQASDQARKAADARAEGLRGVALAPRHEAYRGHLKVRLTAPAADLARSADALHGDVEARLEVVQAMIAEIDEDRRFVLGQLDKVAMDGVLLLRAAESASRLPAGLGAWGGEPFLRIRAEIAGHQAERQARLEPLLDRLVAKGMIPGGRDLVDQAVRELAGQRIDATLLKPDALLRRDRMPVTEMQTFSRGQQLTVAILLYCTMARLRAQQRGRGHRPDGGVLLLDNPVGTCSSVPLLDLQREVARQMRVQLVYTTGVNDPNAVATFPNTVRLRNAHRARATGDLHVTHDEAPSVEAVRVVAV